MREEKEGVGVGGAPFAYHYPKGALSDRVASKAVVGEVVMRHGWSSWLRLDRWTPEGVNATYTIQVWALGPEDDTAIRAVNDPRPACRLCANRTKHSEARCDVEAGVTFGFNLADALKDALT